MKKKDIPYLDLSFANASTSLGTKEDTSTSLGSVAIKESVTERRENENSKFESKETEELKEMILSMKNDIDRINEKLEMLSESDKVKRLTSRCDALVGNTQMIISNQKEMDKSIKIMNEEIAQNDMLNTTLHSKTIENLHTLVQKVDKLTDIVNQNI